jgi:hypothetical protein
LLFNLSGRCPEALSLAAIARMAEHVLDGRTRADAANRELPEFKLAMTAFYLTTALSNCMGRLRQQTVARTAMNLANCIAFPGPQAHARASTTMSSQVMEGQSISQDRAIDLAIRALQYFGARRLHSIAHLLSI